MKKKSRRKYYRDKNFLVKIGRRIRRYRLAQEMTQTHLAFACKNIDYTQIGKMERGEVNFTISYLVLVANALNILPRDLLPPS